MNILITGATGFIGSALLERLRSMPEHHVIAASRGKTLGRRTDVATIQVQDCGPDTDWGEGMSGVEAVIHLAACVHETERGEDALAVFRRVNTEGTLNLARQAIAAGVRRFIFVSTVKVNGESTAVGCPYRIEDVPAAHDPYGISKQEAEDGLRVLAAESRMELVIVRPPLVYGPGVGANFLRLMRWVECGVPLPFAALENRRSLLYVGNLVDFLLRCLEHPAAAGEAFLISDGEDFSTTELVRRLALALGRPARLFPVPLSLTRALLHVSGREDLWLRLFGSLQVDASRAAGLLGWAPPFSVEEGLGETARWYHQHQRAAK